MICIHMHCRYDANLCVSFANNRNCRTLWFYFLVRFLQRLLCSLSTVIIRSNIVWFFSVAVVVVVQKTVWFSLFVIVISEFCPKSTQTIASFVATLLWPPTAPYCASRLFCQYCSFRFFRQIFWLYWIHTVCRIVVKFAQGLILLAALSHPIATPKRLWWFFNESLLFSSYI